MNNTSCSRMGRGELGAGSCDVSCGRGRGGLGLTTSKEVLVALLQDWSPQLSSSYRPGVDYAPSDLELYWRLFGQQPARSLACTLPPSPVSSPSARKFKVAEHVVSACQHFQKIDKSRAVSRKSAE